MNISEFNLEFLLPKEAFRVSGLCLGFCNIDDAFIKKQKHLKAQAFAFKMRPRKETLEVNFVSTQCLFLLTF